MNRILVYGLSQDKLGGIETFLVNMNKFMSDNTIFDYIIEGDHTIHQREIDQKGGKCFFISPKKRVLANIKDWKKLLEKQKTNYRLIYFNLYSLAWIPPILLALNKGYQVVVHAHNNKLHNSGAFQKCLHFLNRHYQKHLNIIRFTNSELSSKFFFGNQPAELIYNAVDTKRFSFNQENRNKIRQQLGIVGGQHLYGFSGRLSYQKNPSFLIDIFREIAKSDPRAKLILCGDGDLKDKIEQRAKRFDLQVIFAGNVRNIENYYQAMDCLILPSRFEGLGLVLIETQTSGLLSFTSKGVVPENAKQTELLHYISLKQNARSWASCILKYVGAPVDRTAYASIIASTNFNILIEAKRLEKILSQL